MTTKDKREAGRRAITKLGLDRQECELHKLALYIYSLEAENAALRQRVDILNPMRKPTTVAA
jgi:hypothetical protein